MLIDTHSHLNLYQYNRFGGDFCPALKQIEGNEIHTIAVSMDVSSYESNKRIAKKSDFIVPVFGIHPWNALRYSGKVDLIKKLIRENSIIGEIGLDHFFVKDSSRYAAQRKVFELFLSESEDKVLSIHTKGAEHDVLDLLKAYGNKRVIIHWYSGGIEPLKEMVTEGFYFSVGLEINYSDHLRKIASMIPLERLLVETDNPGGPAWLIKKKGMPILIKDIIALLGEIKGRSSEEMEKQVQENFARLTKGLKIFPISFL